MTDDPLEENDGRAIERYGFDLLTEDEKIRLAALPYRVGYWISQADQTGGEKSDQMELAALECLITSYAQDMCKSEFMQKLMEETIRQKASWSVWQGNIEEFPEECRKACVLLADRLDEKELSGFQENLFEIALSVAGAFREDLEMMSPTEKIKNFSSEFISKISSLAGRSADNEVYSKSISPKERAALNKLKELLGV
jgi:hypothetical protein